MVKVFYGEKGTGKTKKLVDSANHMVVKAKGDIVFIDDSNQLIYDLKHEIRFINITDFPINGQNGFLGFICGIISQDYDIEGIFIDGLTYILKEDISSMATLFKKINDISKKFGIDFYISINGKINTAPDFLGEYIA